MGWSPLLLLTLIKAEMDSELGTDELRVAPDVDVAKGLVNDLVSDFASEDLLLMIVG